MEPIILNVTGYMWRAGSVSYNYAYYCPEQTKGTSLNLCFYSSGTTASLLMGPLGLGALPGTNPLLVHVDTNANFRVRNNEGLELASAADGTAFSARPMNFNASSVAFKTGSVGIGTTTPAVALDVNGIIKTQERSTATCDGNVIKAEFILTAMIIIFTGAMDLHGFSWIIKGFGFPPF